MNKTESNLCVNCKVREGSTVWVGEGGTLAYVHGGGRWWCRYCCLVAQIAYAEQLAAQLPALRHTLNALEAMDKV